jgi:hypothetical protein
MMTQRTIVPGRAARRELLVPIVPLLVVGTAVCGLMVWVALSSGLYSDFAVFYDSARALREGRDLYFSALTKAGWRNMNPPHFIMLMAPLASLPMREALIVWWIITAMAMAGCVVLWQRALPQGWAVALLALLLASAAGYLNVRAGNQTWVTAFAVTWAWMAWRSKQYRRAACVLGLMASIKPFLLIMLPYFCWRRRPRAVVAFLGGIAAACAVGLVVCGPAAYVSWFRSLSEQTWQGQALSMSILGGITRALDTPHDHAPVSVLPQVIVPSWLVASAVIATVLWWKLRTHEDADRDFAAILTAMLLVTPAGWVYYVPIAAGPLAAALASSRTTSWFWSAGTLLLLMPYPFAASAPSAAWATLTLSSVYMWGGLLLLVGTLRAPVTGALRSKVS